MAKDVSYSSIQYKDVKSPSLTFSFAQYSIETESRNSMAASRMSTFVNLTTISQTDSKVESVISGHCFYNAVREDLIPRINNSMTLSYF